jgi:RNA polymerase sigma factor (sigma-70 family)
MTKRLALQRHSSVMEDVDADRRLAELTAEMAWLQRLTCALLQTEDAADLAQDTWLAAHERVPRDGRPLRPWLTRVARNLVRMKARSKRRRESRELAAESFRDSAPTPDVLVERVELQRHVAGEVLALNEPYRSTVLLHYFEELSCAEIARRLAIPEATVRGRLKVALDQLRTRLAPRKSLAPLLAPLAAIQPTAHKTATVAVGAIAMKKVVVLVVLALLFVIAAVWWTHRSSDDPDTSAHTLQLTKSLAPAGVPVAGASNIPLWMTAAALPARQIAGRVEYAGTPVAGVMVRLAIESRADVLLPVAELRSDSAGVFDFGIQPAATFTISAEAPGHSAAAITMSVADPNAKPDQLILVLGGCNLRIEGMVLDASGGPIEKARVTSSGLGGIETDAHGHYTLCLNHQTNEVRVEANGYGALEARVIMNGPMHQDFRLAPEGVVVGVVVTETNQPVPGARVIVSPDPIERAQSLAPGWAITDDDGAFRVAGLAPGRYRLTAASDGRASSTPLDAVVHASSTSASMVIRVTTTTRLRGHVMMAGKPVVGARVSATAIRSERRATRNPMAASSSPVCRLARSDSSRARTR